MPLTTEPYLLPQKNEKSKEQAQRVFNHLKSVLEQDPNKKIALLYSANNQQAELFHNAYKTPKEPETLPMIRGAGQALLFGELIKLVNADPKLVGRIRILPIASSLYGRNNTPGNIVTPDMLKRDLDAIQTHLKEGYDVEGIPTKNNGFAIGGGVSGYWYNIDYASIKQGNKFISQGEYIQTQLNGLKENINFKIVTPVAGSTVKEILGYKHATTGSDGRDHAYDLPTEGLKDEFKQFKGDILKTRILLSIKDKLSTATTTQELNAIIDLFKKSSEYKVLETGQGITTRLFHLKTHSVEAFEKMVEDARSNLNQAAGPTIS